jgi:hypothetical protein
MTYAEATRQAAEDASWIRNADVERLKRIERLQQCRAVILANIDHEPPAAVPDAPAVAPVAPVPFFAVVHDGADREAWLQRMGAVDGDAA